MAISPQSAMTGARVRTRPPLFRSPHELVPTEAPTPARTVAKIVGLVAIAALGTALTVAIVGGIALFLLLSLN